VILRAGSGAEGLEVGVVVTSWVLLSRRMVTRERARTSRPWRAPDLAAYSGPGTLTPFRSSRQVHEGSADGVQPSRRGYMLGAFEPNG